MSQEGLALNPSAPSTPITSATSDVSTVFSIHEQVSEGYEFDEEFGCKVPHADKLRKLLDEIDNWDFDVFAASEVTGGRPLTVVAYSILKKRDLLTALYPICPKKLVRFLVRAENLYLEDAIYHNKEHAADVTQAAHVILNSPPLKAYFDPLDVFSCLIAATVHDVGHPGVDDNFLKRTGMIYGTDIKEHPRWVRRLINGAKITPEKLMDKKTQRRSSSESFSALCALLHCADISNTMRPLNLYLIWAELITDELFRQGDLEREQGLHVTPICDRTVSNMLEIQNFAIPAWKALRAFANHDKSVDAMLTNAKLNMTHWMNLSNEQCKNQPTDILYYQPLACSVANWSEIWKEIAWDAHEDVLSPSSLSADCNLGKMQEASTSARLNTEKAPTNVPRAIAAKDNKKQLPSQIKTKNNQKSLYSSKDGTRTNPGNNDKSKTNPVKPERMSTTNRLNKGPENPIRKSSNSRISSDQLKRGKSKPPRVSDSGVESNPNPEPGKFSSNRHQFRSPKVSTGKRNPSNLSVIGRGKRRPDAGSSDIDVTDDDTRHSCWLKVDTADAYFSSDGVNTSSGLACENTRETQMIHGRETLCETRSVKAGLECLAKHEDCTGGDEK
ncbi:unnamed protein product [Notodromas monacha]|uniref:PDEase domain-containing protein n=1 Tax=Notodromas monacha TaxID=399045 RepID=A0A7R9GBI5_9CRUS|nr:unnamed protein product [Notodromas monacha]CAG0915098.1 unnamed protein product [Notodromas monacha]